MTDDDLTMPTERPDSIRTGTMTECEISTIGPLVGMGTMALPYAWCVCSYLDPVHGEFYTLWRKTGGTENEVREMALMAWPNELAKRRGMTDDQIARAGLNAIEREFESETGMEFPAELHQELLAKTCPS